MDVNNLYKYMKRSVGSNSNIDVSNVYKYMKNRKMYYNVLDDDIYLDDIDDGYYGNYGGGNGNGNGNGYYGGIGYYGNYNDGYYNDYGYYYDDNNYDRSGIMYSYSYSYSSSYNNFGSYSYQYNNHNTGGSEYSDQSSSGSRAQRHIPLNQIPSFTNRWCSKIQPCSLSSIKIIVSLLFFLYCFMLVPATNFNFWKKKPVQLARKYRRLLNASYCVVLITTIILAYYTFAVSLDKCMSNAIDRVLRFLWIGLVSTDVVIATDQTNLIIFGFLTMKVILDMISLMYALQVDASFEKPIGYNRFSDDNYILVTEIIEYLTWCLILCMFYFSSNMYLSEDTIKSMADHLKPKKKVTKNKVQYEQLNNAEDDDDEEMRLQDDDYDSGSIEMKRIKVENDIEESKTEEREGLQYKEESSKAFERPKCLEYEASMCSRLYFMWVYPLLSKGFEKGELKNEDLGSLQGVDVPKTNFIALLEAIEKRKKTGSNESLLSVLFKLHGADIAFSGLLIAVSIAGAIGSIFCLNLLLEDLETHPYINWSTKYCYAFLLLIGKMIESSFEHTFWMEGIKISLRMQNALISMCTYKSLRLSATSKIAFDSGKIINLINVDARKLTTLFVVCLLHWGSWVSIFTLMICIFSLKKIVGGSSLLGLLIIVGSLPMTFYISKSVKKYYQDLQRHRDKRAKLMGEAVKEVRYLKAFNCEGFINSLLSAYRESELFSCFLYQCSLMAVVMNTEITVVIVPVTILGYYSLSQNGNLSSATVFTTLAWCSYLTRTIKAMPNLISTYYETTASLSRIDMLLKAPERLNEIDWLQHLKSEKKIDEKVESSKFGAGKELKLGETATVVLKDASFSWTLNNQQADPVYILRNININIGPEQLIFIIGHVGSGKTTLLLSILGETEASANSIIDIKGSTSYVSDRPWLSANKSIKDNILMGRAYDEVWYEKCLNACCLMIDLKDLPAGDMSVIGERGINLSGGQRQRINLCRAIYAKPDIIVLDDVFSALDNVTGKSIFDACFTQTGILSKSIKIIATHQYNFLYSRHVDSIIVLKDGSITNQGNMETLLKSQDQDTINLIKSGVEKDENLAEKPNLKTKSMSVGELQKLLEVSERTQVSAEHKEYGAVKFKYMKNYMRGWGSYWLIVLVILMAVSEQILNVTITFRYSYITEKCDSTEGCSKAYKRTAMHLIFFMVGCLALLKLIRAGGFVQGNYLASKRFEESMRKGLFAAKISWFDRQLTGRIVNRIVSDISAIDQLMPHISLNLLQTILSFLAVLVLVIVELPIALFSFVVAPLYYRIYQFYRWPSRDLKRLESISRSPVNSQLNEFMTGLTTVRAFGLQLQMMREHLKLLDDSVRCYFYQWIANQWVTTSIELLGCVYSSSITFSAIYYTLNKKINPSTAAMMISYANAIPMTLGLMLKFFCQTEIEAVSVERISEYIELPPEESGGDRMPASNFSSENYGKGDIKFVNFSLRYSDDTSDSLAVLKNINLSITPGQKVAIVGRTGAGKSSFFSALFRYYEYEGNIMVNGLELKDLNLREVRSMFSLIPQDPLLLGLTLRSALTCGLPLPDEDIWSALTSVQMDEKIRKREGGLDMELNFGEDSFSSGEKQLLCAARALLKKAPILLCDEIASSLDQTSDEIINNTILHDEKKTVISIMHRLQQCKNFDRIIVLKSGEVIEDGTFEELLSNKQGIFYEMINVQR